MGLNGFDVVRRVDEAIRESTDVISEKLTNANDAFYGDLRLAA